MLIFLKFLFVLAIVFIVAIILTKFIAYLKEQIHQRKKEDKNAVSRFSNFLEDDMVTEHILENESDDYDDVKYSERYEGALKDEVMQNFKNLRGESYYG